MQTGDKEGDGNRDNKCVAKFGTAKGDNFLNWMAAEVGNGDKWNVDLIDEGDNFRNWGAAEIGDGDK